MKPAVTVETEVQQLIDLSDVQQQGEVNYKNMPSVVVLLERLVLDKGSAESGVSKEVCHEGSVSIEVERNEGAFAEGPTEGEVPESGKTQKAFSQADKVPQCTNQAIYSPWLFNQS